MPAARHCSSADTFEMKVQMEKRLGVQKAEKYFSLLTRFLSLKIEKSEFDKVCVKLVGRENVKFHNELIRAVVRNAVVCETPPVKQVRRDGNGVDARNGLQSLCRDVFPQSARKGRTPNIRERKFKDRPSPLGVCDNAHMARETAKVNEVVNGKEVLQDELSTDAYRRSLITAPFAINVYSNKKRKVLHKGLGTSSFEERLKEKVKTKGLDISIDCVNLLNKGLESYLKRVVKPSLELARSRSLQKPGTGFTTSMLDFRLAIETNPKVLGEDWPIQLEKISLLGSNSTHKFMSQ